MATLTLISNIKGSTGAAGAAGATGPAGAAGPTGPTGPAGSGGYSDVAAVVTASGALVSGKHNPVNASSGNKAMTLANAGTAGLQVSFEKTDATANTVVLTLNLRGTAGQTLTLNDQFQAMVLVSKADGSWWPVADHRTRTTLDTRYKFVINAKAEYGATGDGSTDDTAALNAALAAVDLTKGLSTVVIPTGTYMVNGVNTSNPEHNGRWRGGGLLPKAGTTISLAADAILKIIPNTSPSYAGIYLGPGIDNVTIRGGQMVGDRDTHDYATDTSYPTFEFGYGICAEGAQNMTIDGMTITKMMGDCMCLGPSGNDKSLPGYLPSSGRIVNNTLDGARRNNISLIGSDHFVVENNTITRAGYNDGVKDGCSPRAGIDLEWGLAQEVRNTTIRNNRFVGNVTCSINDYNGRNTIIDGNFSDNTILISTHNDNEVIVTNNQVINRANTTTVGISLASGGFNTERCIVSDNIVIGFAYSIGLSGLNTLCSGNLVREFAVSGISTYQADQCTITGNRIEDPSVTGSGTIGVSIGYPPSAPARHTITDNIITGCYAGVYWQFYSTGAIVKGNTILKGYAAFNPGSSQAVIEGNLINLPGHASGQGSDISYSAGAQIDLIGNTFLNSSTVTIAGTGGSGGLSKIIGNTIQDTTTSTYAISVSAGTHDIIDNTMSLKVASGTVTAIAITGASVNSKVIGNTAYHTGATPWSRLVNSSSATGTPATIISGNTFLGATVATTAASDVLGENFATTRITSKRVFSTASTTTLTPDVNNFDAVKVTAQAAALTIAAPTGTPAPFQSLLIRIKDNGTARALTWDAAYRGTLPSTTVIGATIYISALWNADDSKWDSTNLAASGGGGAVSSVAGRTGAVTLTADDVPDGSTNKAYTATEKTKLAAITGTNTGDQNLTGYYQAGGTDVAVADGGTGRSTASTAYGIIAAGTTASGVQQTITPGSSGNFLKSNGASALASFASIATTDVSGLGTLATQSGTFSGTSSGTNTGDQTSVTGNAGTATKLATARNINGVAFDGSADITLSGSAPATQLPSDQNLISWTYDPAMITGGTIPSAGNLLGVRLPIRAATSITNIIIAVNTAGSGLTSGQNFAAIYQGGTLLGTTADQSTPWASTGIKTMAISGGAVSVSAGYVDVAFWSNGTTRPAFGYGSGNTAYVNVGLTGSALRSFIADGGLTTTAPSTMGGKFTNLMWWMGVS